jgi:hypothetical protein
MEETSRITLEMRTETLEAFCEAARRAGLSPGTIVESLIQDFLRKEGNSAFHSQVEGGTQGKPLEEIFKVRIECEDELCRTPRIRMDTRSLAQKNKPDQR